MGIKKIIWLGFLVFALTQGLEAAETKPGITAVTPKAALTMTKPAATPAALGALKKKPRQEALPTPGDPLQKKYTPVRDHDLEVRELLSTLSRDNGFSLMVGRGVRGIIDKVKGSTIGEILNQGLLPLGCEWRFLDGCLYVGEQGTMDDLWKMMNTPFKAKAKLGRKLSADFREIDLPNVCGILRKFSGIDIRVTDTITGNMTMRIVDMPWERVLLGIVFLNGYRMMESDFAILIYP